MRLPKRDEIAALLTKALDKALTVQAPMVRSHIDRVRKAHPQMSKRELVERVERRYLASVAALGGAAGAAAAVPAAGAAVALPINIVEVGSFIEATALYVMALAEIY